MEKQQALLKMVAPGSASEHQHSNGLFRCCCFCSFSAFKKKKKKKTSQLSFPQPHAPAAPACAQRVLSLPVGQTPLRRSSGRAAGPWLVPRQQEPGPEGPQLQRSLHLHLRPRPAGWTRRRAAGLAAQCPEEKGGSASLRWRCLGSTLRASLHAPLPELPEQRPHRGTWAQGNARTRPERVKTVRLCGWRAFTRRILSSRSSTGGRTRASSLTAELPCRRA